MTERRARLAAHIQTAAAHERSAEFHSPVAEFLEARGDDLDATRAVSAARTTRRQATQERIYALEAGGAPHPRATGPASWHAANREIPYRFKHGARPDSPGSVRLMRSTLTSGSLCRCRRPVVAR